MDYKIIETRSDLPDVLLYRDVLEEDNELIDVVIVQACGETPEEPDALEWTRVQFPDIEMCRQFIKDYSADSAIKFCEARDIVYRHPNHAEEESTNTP